MTAYFMGVPANEQAGHYCQTPDGRRYPKGSPSPWAGLDPLGDAECPAATWGYDQTNYRQRDDHPSRVQPEGVARVVHRDGWTLLTCWDRSADARKGSHASFAFAATLDPEAALAEARRLFPAVWARIDAHLVTKGIAFRVELAPVPA